MEKQKVEDCIEALHNANKALGIAIEFFDELDCDPHHNGLYHARNMTQTANNYYETVNEYTDQLETYQNNHGEIFGTVMEDQYASKD